MSGFDRDDAERAESYASNILAELIEAKAEIERLRSAFEALKDKVKDHARHYGTEVFPDYSYEQLQNGYKPSIDQVSGKMGRHMCDCFLRYIDEALNAKE